MKMTEQEALRRKILLRILGTIIAIFCITFVIYIVTITRYQKSDDKSNIVANKTEIQVENKTADVMTQVSASDENVDTSEAEPSIEEAAAGTESTDINDEELSIQASEVSLSFKDKIESEYSNEMDDADDVYLSDSTYVATTKSYIKNEPYWLFHVVVNDPSQITTTIAKSTAEKRSAYEMNATKPYVLAVPGSDMTHGYTQIQDGVHVYNGELYGNRTETLGNEVVFTQVGYMEKADAGVSYEELNQPGLSWTISVECPTLIDNGVPLDIPEGFSENRSCKIAIGMVKPCEYYFLACSDGDYICNITYAEMRDILAEKSCFFAQALHTEANAFVAMNGCIINDPAVKYGRPQLEYILITDN